MARYSTLLRSSKTAAQLLSNTTSLSRPFNRPLLPLTSRQIRVSHPECSRLRPNSLESPRLLNSKMNPTTLLELLAEVQRGNLSPEAASQRLANLPFENLGHSRIDHHRSLRNGLPEVIYAAGKSPAQTAEIFASMAATGVDVLATRADEATATAVLAAVPKATHHPQARALTLRQSSPVETKGHIAVL